MRILVLHPGALGDVILSLPALGLLRRRYADARLILAGDLDCIPIVAQGLADDFVSLPSLPLHHLFLPPPLTDEAQAFLRAYDRIISWTGYGDPVYRRNLAVEHPAALVASWLPHGVVRRHVSQLFVDSLKPWLGMASEACPVRIPVPPQSRAAGALWLAEQGWEKGAKIVVVHPGAGSPAKRWPGERYRELARTLALRRGIALLLLEGPAEAGLAVGVAEGGGGTGVMIASSLQFPLLTGVLAHCHAYVGNDSGMGHLAAGLGLPSLLIFGPTSPELWAPLGCHVQVLRDAADCPACFDRSRRDHSCMGAIPVAQVLGCLEQLLAQHTLRLPPLC